MSNTTIAIAMMLHMKVMLDLRMLRLIRIKLIYRFPCCAGVLLPRYTPCPWAMHGAGFPFGDNTLILCHSQDTARRVVSYVQDPSSD